MLDDGGSVDVAENNDDVVVVEIAPVAVDNVVQNVKLFLLQWNIPYYYY